MADKKEIQFHLKTTGDPKGAKEIEKAVEKADAAIDKLSEPRPLPVDPKHVKPAEGSLAALTAEVQRLERELQEVAVGGKAFTDLAGRLRVARQTLGDAEVQARKLGGTMGRGGNAGMAVLEFSRAFEDAQYGIRGVLNNIPGLIAMLGGGAGLAGVLSVAAVLGTQLWERLGDSKNADDAMEAMTEAAEKLVARLKAVRDARREVEKMTTTDLSRPIKEEETALKLQTEAFRANIEAIKDRIDAAAALDVALTQAELGGVDSAERSGQLSAEQAAEKRDAIVKAAKEREIARTNELGKLDETVANEFKEAATRELRLAQFKKQAAQERLKEAQEEEAALKAEQKKRNDIKTAQAAVAGAQGDFDRLNIGDFPADSDTLRRLQEGAANERKLAEATGADASENLTVRLAAALEKLLTAQAALSAVEGGNSPRSEPAITGKLEESIKQIEGFKKALADAEELITSKTADLQQAEQSAATAQQRGQEKATARGNQQMADSLLGAQAELAGTEQRMGDEVGKLLDSILSALGNAGNDPAVQQKAGALRSLLENGLQKNEADQSALLLKQLLGKMDAGDRQRGVLFQQMIQTMEKAVNMLASDQGKIDDLNRRLDTVEANQRNSYSR